MGTTQEGDLVRGRIVKPYPDPNVKSARVIKISPKKGKDTKNTNDNTCTRVHKRREVMNKRIEINSWNIKEKFQFLIPPDISPDIQSKIPFDILGQVIDTLREISSLGQVDQCVNNIWKDIDEFSITVGFGAFNIDKNNKSDVDDFDVDDDGDDINVEEMKNDTKNEAQVYKDSKITSVQESHVRYPQGGGNKLLEMKIILIRQNKPFVKEVRLLWGKVFISRNVKMKQEEVVGKNSEEANGCVCEK